MDVRLPNGKVIRNVPEGTPKEEIMQKAIRAGMATEADFAPKQSQVQQPEPYRAQVSDVERQQLRPEESGEIGGFELPNEQDGQSKYDDLYTVALGMMTTRDPQRQMRIIGERFPGVVFDKDEDGNFIVDARPIGGTRGHLNEPGIDSRDVIKFAGNVMQLLPAGRLATGASLTMQGAKVGAASGALQAAWDTYNQALGGTEDVSAGNIDKGEVAGATIGGGLGHVVGSKVGGAIASRLEQRAANRALTEAAPSVEQLKGASRSIYNQLDDMGVTIDQSAMGQLGKRAMNRMLSEGYHPQVHPKVAGTLKAFMQAAKKDSTLTNVQSLRKIAQSAAQSNEPAEARLGAMLVDEVDGFIERVPQTAMKGMEEGADIGSMLKEARGLWARGKKGEMLTEAFRKAENQASGLENGLRVQFRALLNNPKKMRGFSAEEQEALKQVVQGGKTDNVLRALGKLGFSADQSSSMLLATLGVGGGAMVGGAPGGMLVPLIGTVARRKAEALTRGNADLAKGLVRAGNNGKAIVLEYLRRIPKSERSVEELTGLLLREGVDTSGVSQVGADIAKKALNAVSVFAAASGASGEGVSESIEGQLGTQE